MKWVVIAIVGFLVLRFLSERNSASGTASGSSKSGTLGNFSFDGAVKSLTALTNSIGHLFNRDATAVKDPDALESPSF